MNLVPAGKTADYVVSGAWGEKALSEGKTTTALLGGAVRLAGTSGEGDGKEKRYVRLPRRGEVKGDPAAAYLHVTSNETIHGLQYEIDPGRPFPDPGQVPIVADMSSDLLCRPLDFSRFGLVYAGAQKNIGPSGIVVVVISKALVEAGRKDIPKIFQFRTVAENKSLYNTPPTFAIYLVRNVLLWIKELGGPAGHGGPQPPEGGAPLHGHRPERLVLPVPGGEGEPVGDERRLPAPHRGARGALRGRGQGQGMIGLKGHRSVGGIRASIYNAVQPEWVDALATFMDDFAKKG